MPGEDAIYKGTVYIATNEETFQLRLDVVKESGHKLFMQDLMLTVPPISVPRDMYQFELKSFPIIFEVAKDDGLFWHAGGMSVIKPRPRGSNWSALEIREELTLANLPFEEYESHYRPLANGHIIPQGHFFVVEVSRKNEKALVNALDGFIGETWFVAPDSKPYQRKKLMDQLLPIRLRGLRNIEIKNDPVLIIFPTGGVPPSGYSWRSALIPASPYIVVDEIIKMNKTP